MITIDEALNVSRVAQAYMTIKAALRKHDDRALAGRRVSWQIDTGTGVVEDGFYGELSKELLTVLHAHLHKKLKDLGVDPSADKRKPLKSTTLGTYTGLEVLT